MKSLRNFIIFAAGFLAIASGLSAWLPFPEVPTVSDKLRRYAEAGDDFDVLAIGSSRTYRQIIPKVFDETASAAGKPTRTFNLGIDGMRPPEDTYVLERALALRKKPLRLVIVECNTLRSELRPDDIGTVRSVYWHDWKRTMALAQLAFFSDAKARGFWDRMKRRSDAFPGFWPHAECCFQRFTALGRGHEYLASLTFDSKPTPSYIGLDGFKDPPNRSGLAPSELAAYTKDVEQMKKTPPRFERGEWISQIELAEKRRIIEKAGAKMVLVIPPYPMTKRFLPENPAERAGVIDFSNPNEFPELYAPENRLDEGHTNRVGSEIYTRIIVERILPQL